MSFSFSAWSPVHRSIPCFGTCFSKWTLHNSGTHWSYSVVIKAESYIIPNPVSYNNHTYQSWSMNPSIHIHKYILYIYQIYNDKKTTILLQCINKYYIYICIDSNLQQKCRTRNKNMTMCFAAEDPMISAITTISPRASEMNGSFLGYEYR